MKKALVFGSVNIDYTYDVDHFVRAGETLASSAVTVSAGGKGQNQAIALAKAGADTYHAGRIGADGLFLTEYMTAQGVHCLDDTTAEKTGTAVIQRDKNGQNGILLFAGANHQIERSYMDDILARFDAGDLIVLQNEINANCELMEKASAAGLEIVFNPSPFDETIYDCDLSKVRWFFINEIEGNMLTGNTDPDDILDEMIRRYPESRVVLTLGSRGSHYAEGDKRLSQDSCPCRVVDTTGAGDTFTGFFLSAFLRGKEPADCLRTAARAAAIAVSRPGAAQSIPSWDELTQTREV